MAATSRRRVAGPILRSFSPSPAGRFHAYSHSPPAALTSASAFASSTSSLSTSFLHRSASRTISSSPTPPSTCFRSISAASMSSSSTAGGSQKRTCMCSPTAHPGSFRCSLHKNCGGGGGGGPSPSRGPYHSNSRFITRRSSMTNSLVRIETVEGDLVGRALKMLIRPSSHRQRRRADFQPRPSRLSVMSKAEDSWCMR